MSSVFKKFPWKKDKDLFEEATELFTKRQYENWVIFEFGYKLATSELSGIDLVFRGRGPDAILINEKTEETLNIEFEEFSSNFKKHAHDPEKFDLIVCRIHDWEEMFPDEKCPLPVYTVDGKFFPKEKQV